MKKLKSLYISILALCMFMPGCKEEVAITAISVKDSQGRTTGGYTYSESAPGTFQLTAATFPAGHEADVVWSSDNDDVATVSNTGFVTLTGEGMTYINARIGSIRGLYTVINSVSILDLAVGYWTFDDPANLGKATKGKDLILKQVTAVAGPAPGNGAIQGEKKVRNVECIHGLTGKSLRNFSIMWDAAFPPVDGYYASYWNGTYGNDGSLFFRFRTSEGGLQGGAGSYHLLVPYTESDPAPWVRIVATISAEEGQSDATIHLFVNGERKTPPGFLRSVAQTGLSESVNMFFLSDGGNGDDPGDGDDGVHPLSALAIWDYALTDIEIASLGEVGN